MAKEPRVTVLMPVYNGGAFLRPAVDSVLAQTFRDFELLIIDDGSTDGSLKTIEAERDSRIRLVHNPENLGLITTLNRGIELVTGTYLARMDADDLCEPRRFERQVEYLDTHPEVGVCSTWATFIDAAGRETGILQTPTGRLLERQFWRPSPLIHPAVMARTTLLREHRYATEFADAEDYELWLRIHARTRFHNLSEPLLRLRRHGKNVSMVRRENQLRNSYRAFSRFVGDGLVDYESFLSLIFVTFSINPVRRLVAHWRASRYTGIDGPSFLRDNWKYARQWYRHARAARKHLR
jgi:glycosyltransferase involved in cell wall biosynthesis